MKLRARILSAGLPLVVILVAVSAYSAWTMQRLGGMADDILKANFNSVLAAQRMETALEAVDSALVTSGERRSSGSLAAPVAAFERELGFQESNVTEPGEGEATRELRAAFERWRSTLGGLERERGHDARWRHYLAHVRPAAEAIRGATARIVALNQDAMVRKSIETRREVDGVSRMLVILGVAALLVASLIGFVLAGRIAQPLARLATSARRIGDGDLEVAIDGVEGDDELASLVGELRAMTERLRAYRRSSLGELLDATEAAQAAIDSLADPIMSFTEGGAFRRANEAARTTLAVAPDAPEPLAALAPELRAAVERARDGVLEGKGPQAPRGLENALPILVEGRPRYVQPIATPIHAEPSGAIVGVTVLLRDVTTLRHADELKTDLLSTVAHELRTPLTSMRMSLHLCLEGVVGPLTEKQLELLHTAREEAERLHRLVEGILSVSKIEAGVLVGRRRPVEPRRLVDAAVAPFRVPAADRRIALTAQAPDFPTVEVDLDSVVLVLTNMIGNAIKHTPEGGNIDVTVEATDDAVTFNVKDSGPGIAAEHRPRLFEKFYRVPGSPPGGTGLGLSIARDVVFAHDGEIGVESEVGKGSRFWFRLPVKRPGSESGRVETGPPA